MKRPPGGVAGGLTILLGELLHDLAHQRPVSGEFSGHLGLGSPPIAQLAMSTWCGPQWVETLHMLYPYDRLQEAGFEPVVAGPEQCTFQMVMHEVRANSAFAEVEPEDYLAIF